MTHPERKRIRFDELNVAGKAVYVAGAAVTVTARFIDRALERAADLVVETERAFRRGLDDSIEDARILDEYEERNPRS